MKNILLLAFFLGSTLAIGQTVKKNKKVKDFVPSSEFQAFQSSCSKKEFSDCWEVGMWWDEKAVDILMVTKGVPFYVHFYFYPKSELNCEDPKSYKLTPIEGAFNENKDWLTTWEYKDADISIRFRMIGVKTVFGYSSFDLKVTNYKNNSCVGPATGTTTF